MGSAGGGAAPRQDHLFAGSLLENIRFVKPGAAREEVREALAKLDGLETIEAIPEGLDAEVGERGSGLRLEQSQLTCFVRALIADPRIPILDEAPSAIDPLTEAMTRRATRLLKEADWVVVMGDEKVVEQGEPGALLAGGGAFAALRERAVGV
jgi:ATP-binding cassette subfamily B protein